MDALLEGASDFIAKPGPADVAQAGSPQERIRDLLLPRIQSLFPAAFAEKARPSYESVSAPVDLSHLRPDVLLIGSSTGGPTVLEKIFTGIRGCSIPAPILIVQHMPRVFTEALAARLQKASGIHVHEAKHRQRVEPGSAYLAPGGFHMRVVSSEARLELRLDEGPLVNFVRPAVDPLFESAVSIFGQRCLGVILTGMGMDGREGARSVKRAGGAVIIQDEESAVVYGMPGAVRTVGAFDAVMTPDKIIEYFRALAARGQQYRGEAKGA
jgi:two-component system chemotaxis response regulator CheB